MQVRWPLLLGVTPVQSAVQGSTQMQLASHRARVVHKDTSARAVTNPQLSVKQGHLLRLSQLRARIVTVASTVLVTARQRARLARTALTQTRNARQSVVRVHPHSNALRKKILRKPVSLTRPRLKETLLVMRCLLETTPKTAWNISSAAVGSFAPEDIALGKVAQPAPCLRQVQSHRVTVSAQECVFYLQAMMGLASVLLGQWGEWTAASVQRARLVSTRMHQAGSLACLVAQVTTAQNLPANPCRVL